MSSSIYLFVLLVLNFKEHWFILQSKLYLYQVSSVLIVYVLLKEKSSVRKLLFT